jgi:hypothetical protein
MTGQTLFERADLGRPASTLEYLRGDFWFSVFLYALVVMGTVICAAAGQVDIGDSFLHDTRERLSDCRV